MKHLKENVAGDDSLNPNIEQALTLLGLRANAADVSSTVTGSTHADWEDAPDPYASEEPQLLRRQEPKPKDVYINGKHWLDITDVLGNSEEIIALRTVPGPPKKSKSKLPHRTADGVLTRERSVRDII